MFRQSFDQLIIGLFARLRWRHDIPQRLVGGGSYDRQENGSLLLLAVDSVGQEKVLQTFDLLGPVVLSAVELVDTTECTSGCHPQLVAKICRISWVQQPNRTWQLYTE